jgi:hypothetical protein
MINATQNPIESNFNGDKKDIASKAQRDDYFAEVSEAPVVSYDGIGEQILHKSDSPRSYVATGCQESNNITHTASPGELHIVNTKVSAIVVKVNGVDIPVQPCAWYKVNDVKFENKKVTIEMGGVSADINPGIEDIWDSVIFDDDDIKSYRIKALDL